MIYENPNCECGEELEFDTDTDLWVDGGEIVMVCYGHCTQCGKKYRWLDHYIISHFTKVTEVKTE